MVEMRQSASFPLWPGTVASHDILSHGGSGEGLRQQSPSQCWRVKCAGWVVSQGHRGWDSEGVLKAHLFQEAPLDLIPPSSSCM